MKKQKQQKSKVMMGVLLGVLAVAVLGSAFGMVFSIGKVKEIAISRTPDAILASAGVENGADANLAVTYWDQRQDECVNFYDLDSAAVLRNRQFEWTGCGYSYNEGVEEGLVEFYLGSDYLPVAREGGRLTVNRGVRDFSRWFSSIEEKSQEYTGSLNLKYRVNGGASEFSYENEEFYPVDGMEFSVGDEANGDGHNHLFTMSFSVPFSVLANGNESFEITADDDTFVFIGEKLALDMGGVNRAATGRFRINEDGEIYSGVANGEVKISDDELAYSGITVNDGAVVRIFHADRDSENSKFKVRFSGMNLNVVNSELAEGDGVQIAYNPDDPTYVAPLGETMVFSPDGTRGFIIIATVFGMVIVVSSMFAVMAVKRLVRR